LFSKGFFSSSSELLELEELLLKGTAFLPLIAFPIKFPSQGFVLRSFFFLSRSLSMALESYLIFFLVLR